MLLTNSILRWIWPSLKVVSITVLIMLAVTVYCPVRFGSLRAARAWLNGHKLCLIPEEMLINDELIESSKLLFKVQNISNERIRILGSSATCGCLSLGEMPSTFEPASTIELLIKIEKNSRNTTEAEFVLFTDCPGQESIRGKVSWKQ